MTTYRRLAEEAIDRLGGLLESRAAAWTRSATLPGGDMPRGDFAAYRAELARRRPWLDNALLRRYSRAYGTRVERLLGVAESMRELGLEVLPGLYEREIEYLRREEWAVTAEDILFRRSKLGLHLPVEAMGALAGWLAEHPAGRSPFSHGRGRSPVYEPDPAADTGHGEKGERPLP
jgi:glycerol-3-phosphate dehydrogenase